MHRSEGLCLLYIEYASRSFKINLHMYQNYLYLAYTNGVQGILDEVLIVYCAMDNLAL